MTIQLTYIAVLVMITGIGHFAALYAGLYNGKVWVDIPLHALGGVFLGLIWIWLNQRFAAGNDVARQSFLAMSISIVEFALAGSFLWELVEFTFWNLLPVPAAQLKIYSASVGDVLSDMVAGVSGGLLVAVFYGWKITRNQQTDTYPVDN